MRWGSSQIMPEGLFRKKKKKELPSNWIEINPVKPNQSPGATSKGKYRKEEAMLEVVLNLAFYKTWLQSPCCTAPSVKSGISLPCVGQVVSSLPPTSWERAAGHSQCPYHSPRVGSRFWRRQGLPSFHCSAHPRPPLTPSFFATPLYTSHLPVSFPCPPERVIGAKVVEC